MDDGAGRNGQREGREAETGARPRQFTQGGGGSVIEVWAVIDPAVHGAMSVLGVFADRAAAQDYVDNGAPEPREPCHMVPVRRAAMRWDGDGRVSLFDDQLFGPYELSPGRGGSQPSS